MTMYQVKITLQAKEHLALIRDYIAIQLKAPETAKNILHLFQKHMNSLSFMPQRISCIEESPWRENGIRKIRVKNYYIYFGIIEEKKQVHILSVICTKRNQEQQLSSIQLPPETYPFSQ